MKQNYKSKKRHYIFKSEIADELTIKGEKLLLVRPDLKDKNRSVFVFADSESFNKNKDEIFIKLGLGSENYE